MRELAAKLTAEGYGEAESHLMAPTLRKQLRAAWLAAGKRRVN